ncbi:MAG TPA: PhzF family phenazine biosynthesis protein [Kouleothrix sp.]|uniref:PhzF family phenazine biosynthesis protein n=1 Tax=Kouleothrix sp. TaxID=2779161 RepID=UPI002CFAEFC1|nr:PhzF family phenazine biosynthesis protein [Kouleothrix sp.]HRC77844.1 PhzF family phenazine biosynthesis protein [Kouleothrix sp.]
MPTFPFMQVDAFTNHPLGGNPCAIVFDADTLDDATMLAIAREMNLSETAFVVRSAVADVGARYFTPAEEIPLAGHPTVATVFALFESGRLRLAGDHTTIALELKVGPIRVDVQASHGLVHTVTMSQKQPQFLATFPADEVLPIFGLAAGDALPGVPIQVVSTGTPQLMLPLRDHAALRRATIADAAAYARFRGAAGFFSPHLFCLGGATPAGQTFARHFGTPPDTSEDPFTGSATGGMAAYLWRYRLIAQPRFVAEQGHWMQRPGQAQVEVVGTPDAIETVRVGGGAVTVLRGELAL